MSQYRLLSVNSDAKTVKGLSKGYLTGVLYLAPADSSGHDVCAGASQGCKQACLNFAGRSRFDRNIQAARIRKTQQLFSDRAGFLAVLARDIEALIRDAARKGLTPALRLNGTSDLLWLDAWAAERFGDRVHVYAYSKLPKSWEFAQRHGYSITFSWSGENAAQCAEAIAVGVNLAVPFDIAKDEPLPETFLGLPVIDGDISDLRFLDPVGVVVGLRVKSVSEDRKSQGIANNFVVSIAAAA